MADEVLTERRGRTLVITINRPEARNAFNLAVAQGLADAMDELDETTELSVAIVTGAGGNFCAGMDLKAFMAGEVPSIRGRGIGFTERPPRKPVIAAVEGYALAGGTEIVLATDLVVASTDAKFGIPEVKRQPITTPATRSSPVRGRPRCTGCPADGSPSASVVGSRRCTTPSACLR